MGEEGGRGAAPQALWAVFAPPNINIIQSQCDNKSVLNSGVLSPLQQVYFVCHSQLSNQHIYLTPVLQFTFPSSYLLRSCL